MFSSKSLTDVPSALSSSNRFWIFVIQSSSYDITQIVWGRASNQPYFRCRQGDDVNPPITWSSWKELQKAPSLFLGVPAVYGNPGTASGTILEYDGGYALIKVSDISSGKNALFLQGVDSAQTTTMVAGDQSRFSTTKDTSGKINVYGVSEYKFAVQQNTSATKSITVAIICARR